MSFLTRMFKRAVRLVLSFVKNMSANQINAAGPDGTNKIVYNMNHNPDKFNLAQLSTWSDAIEYAKKLNKVAGGVSDSHGIYIPSWEPGPQNFEQPNFYDEKTGKAYFHIHYRFKNGKEGINVGLVIDRFKRYPSSPDYVINQLNEEFK